MPRIVVDEDLCQGHAMCVLEAPHLFEVPKRGTVSVVGTPTAADLEAVRSAVHHCPTGALKLEED
jgi:ferredoxin